MKNFSGYVLDTSFISALLNLTDINNKVAIDIYSKIDLRKPIFIPHTVTLELLIFQNQSDKFSKAVGSFFKLISPQFISIDTEFISGLRKFMTKSKYNLTIIDYSILYASNLTQGKILTFDKKLSSFSHRESV